MQGLVGIAEGVFLLGCSPPGRVGSTIGSVSESVEPEAVRSVMTRVADSQLERPAEYPPYDWIVAPFWVGLLTFAPLSRTPARYLESARANGRRNGWQPGPEPFLADDLAITQSYFLLYAVDRDRAEIAPALARFDALLGERFDESLEFSHRAAGVGMVRRSVHGASRPRARFPRDRGPTLPRAHAASVVEDDRLSVRS